MLQYAWTVLCRTAVLLVMVCASFQVAMYRHPDYGSFEAVRPRIGRVKDKVT